MRAYLQLFFSLLVPLSGLFIVASVIYFRTGYDFTKALRLGVLSGFFIAIAVSLFTALFLLIMRRGRQPQKNILKRKKKVHSHKHKNGALKQEVLSAESHTSAQATVPTKTALERDEKTIEQKMMLLMDKELAFEVMLHAIAEQHIGILTKDATDDGQMLVKNDNETIQLSISTLTRHTSQVIITSEINSKAAKKIIRYMKEKEHSFLQY